MTCPECGSEQLVFEVPTDMREYLPEQTELAAICTNCLALEPTDSATDDEAKTPPDETPDFTQISDAFPSGNTGITMALAVGLLDSLALYRSEIADLLERVERGGADPLLVLDRLATDSEVEPHFDLDRRRTQAEQLLYS